MGLLEDGLTPFEERPGLNCNMLDTPIFDPLQERSRIVSFDLQE